MLHFHSVFRYCFRMATSGTLSRLPLRPLLGGMGISLRSTIIPSSFITRTLPLTTFSPKAQFLVPPSSVALQQVAGMKYMINPHLRCKDCYFEVPAQYHKY